MLYHLFVTIPLYHPHPLLVIFAYCLHLTLDLIVLKTGLDSLTNILPRCSLWLGKKTLPKSSSRTHTHTTSTTLKWNSFTCQSMYLRVLPCSWNSPETTSIWWIHRHPPSISGTVKPTQASWTLHLDLHTVAGKMTFFLCKQSTGTSKSCWVPKDLLAIHTDWTNNSFTGRHVGVVQDVPGIFIVLIILLEVTMAFLGTGFWHQATLTKPTMLMITIILHNCP